MYRPRASARSARPAAVALAIGALAAGCRDITSPAQDPTTVTFAPSLGINLREYTKDTSGVYYLDVAVGSGNKATPNSTLGYYYTGYLADGRLFDSRQAPSSAVSTVIGAGQNIRGFDRGLLGVTQGSRRRLIIPPALGYGNQSGGTAIPAGSVLIFEVDVTSVTPPATTTTTSTSG